MARSRTAFLLLALTAVLGSCGAEAPAEITVSVIPDAAVVYPFYSRQFRAYVRNSTDNNVTWSVSGTGRCGTINETGRYTAPPSVPNPARVMVTATSVEDPTKSASAAVELVYGPDDPNQWTWVNGSDQVDERGDYGTKGVSAAANAPGARQSALSWSGPSGTLWLFGGFGYSHDVGILNDLWNYDPAIDQWTWISGGDHPDQVGVYGTKGTPNAANVPGSREWSASWIDAVGRLWLFGGEAYDADGNLGTINDLWRFDPSAGAWTWISGSDRCWESGIYGAKGVADPANMPGGRRGHVSWIDPEGALWLFGGKGFDTTPEQLFGSFNDLWKFDPSTLLWTWMSGTDDIERPGTYGVKRVPDPANVPGGREGASSWTDAEGNLWLFGGSGCDATGGVEALNDLWKFDRVLGQWTWMSGSDLGDSYGTYGALGAPAPTNVPGARTGAVAWTDRLGRLWLFGGYGFAAAGYGRELNDLWRFDPSTLEWTWISGSDQPEPRGIYTERHIVEYIDAPGGRYHAVSWLGPRGDLWLFGGRGYDADRGGHLNDLWRFQF
ncbi:MAG: galactose oxidase [Candidatus Aminicenantes bacterium]|nr:galactose oxidase [Candidatus Aminicenantes bacterium]NLH76332.1 galactose oxidase [Acidobacteriota bacterium]